VFEVEVPVSSPAGTRAVLRVGLDGDQLVTAGVSAARRTALVGIVVVLFSLSVGSIALVLRRRSLEREEAARRISESEMARRRNERLAAAGALAAGLAHEVRSPLNAIVLAAQRIERNQSPESQCGIFARTIRSEAGRMEAVLRHFLELARPVEHERRSTDLHEIAEGVRRLLTEEAEAAGKTLEPVRGTARAVVDGNSIRRAMIDLVQNAIHASSSGGSIELVLSSHSDEVSVQVLDRGSGIDETKIESLFDPFVSGRIDGTGLNRPGKSGDPLS
jgi:signal transduction histidine kinase